MQNFTPTKKQMDEFMHSLEKLKKVRGPLVMALQEAQRIFKYLPREIVELIAEELNSKPEELYSIASFYAQFNFNKVGEYKVSVCMGTACYVKGAQQVLEKVKSVLKIDTGETTEDGKFTLQDSRCIGCCGLAPVMTINEDVYGKLTPKEIPDIMKKYTNGGNN